MKYLVLLLILFTINHTLLSQKIRLPIEYRFKNGELGYTAFFSKNILYPKRFITNGQIANSITRISVNPKGIIDSIQVVNPIDSLTDNEIINVIKLSQNFWKESDTAKKDNVFYIQIAFSTGKNMPNVFNPKTKDLMKIFLKPIIISPPESLVKSNEKYKEHEDKFIPSELISQRVNSLIDSGKFDVVFPFIGELIKRDPFNRELYKARIMINLKLGNNLSVTSDDNKVYNFAEGYSLDDLLKEINDL